MSRRGKDPLRQLGRRARPGRGRRHERPARRRPRSDLRFDPPPLLPIRIIRRGPSEPFQLPRLARRPDLRLGLGLELDAIRESEPFPQRIVAALLVLPRGLVGAERLAQTLGTLVRIGPAIIVGVEHRVEPLRVRQRLDLVQLVLLDRLERIDLRLRSAELARRRLTVLLRIPSLVLLPRARDDDVACVLRRELERRVNGAPEDQCES